MVVCKYTKLNSAAYVPHLDILRGICFTLRRANIDVAFSSGFNPHMQLYMSAPLPIGTQSLCEFFAVATTCDAKQFMQKFNAVSTNDIQITDAVNTDKNPNVYSQCYAASYDVHLTNPNQIHQSITNLLKSTEYIISYTKKGTPQQKDVRKLVIDLKPTDFGFSTLVMANAENLRADRLAQSLTKGTNCQIQSITKTNQYNQSLQLLTL